MTAVQVPVNPARVGRYRAGLPDLLLDLAAALSADRPVGRPTLAACVDLNLIGDRVSDPTPDYGRWPGPSVTRTCSSSPTSYTRSDESTPTVAATRSRGCAASRTRGLHRRAARGTRAGHSTRPGQARRGH